MDSLAGRIAAKCLVTVLLILLLATPTLAYTQTIDFTPALCVADIGAAHMVNNLTVKLDQNSANGGTVYELLGTDGSGVWTRLDSRNVSLAAGVQQTFNFTGGSFRSYWLMLQAGVPAGTTLEWHLNASAPADTPKEILTPYFNFTMKRAPLTLIFDFNQTGTGIAPANYSIPPPIT